MNRISMSMRIKVARQNFLKANLFGIDMLRRDVISVFILVDSSVMGVGILLTRMFRFTNTI